MSMKKQIERVSVYRAQDAGQAIITLAEPFPTYPNADYSSWSVSTRRLHQENAERLADVLFRFLPGGTIDQLLAQIMVRQATLLVAPLPSASAEVTFSFAAHRPQRKPPKGRRVR